MTLPRRWWALAYQAWDAPQFGHATDAETSAFQT
jgi:hypothetical protein